VDVPIGKAKTLPITTTMKDEGGGDQDVMGSRKTRAALLAALEAGGAVESLCHGVAATGALLELL